jgi:hypothetical protein
VRIGLLFVPKRSNGIRPAQFKKAAPEGPSGKRAYQQHDFYFRERDICRTARTAEDLEFLYGPRNLDAPNRSSHYLENNLPPRDVELGRLIGRDEHIAQLWMRLADSFSPVKVLSGLGGVGKISIAYTFAERLIYQAPPYIDRLVWLGAKPETFAALSGRVIPTARVDFDTIDTLLVQLLMETGCPPEQIPEQPSRDQLMGVAQYHLAAFSYLLVVDNVDTLPD